LEFKGCDYLSLIRAITNVFQLMQYVLAIIMENHYIGPFNIWLTMNMTRVRCLPNLHILVALSSLLIAIVSVAAVMSIDNQVAQGQNATTTTNQTESAIQNQTTTNQSAASPFGNLTQSDLQGVKDQLSTARNAIIDGDDETAYEALNDADSELYGKTN
jgi:hypothetical protein